MDCGTVDEETVKLDRRKIREEEEKKRESDVFLSFCSGES